MFEFEQATVEALLNNDDQFRRLFDKHRDLNTQVDAVNSGSATMEHFELETLKKEKLMLRDRMQAMIQAYTAKH
jgi:uncharacterized protein